MLRTLFSGLALSLSLLSAGAAVEAKPSAAPRPNFLWLIAEDFGPHLGCYGAREVSTPNLDRLAAEGVRYTRFFTTAPVCSPSRSAFMTGMYQTTIGAHNHRSHRDDGYKLPEGVRLLTDWLLEAGYFTANLRELPDAFGFRGAGKTDWNFSYEGKPFDSERWADLKAHQPFFAQLNFQETHRSFRAPRRADPAKVDLPPWTPDHPVAREDWAKYLDAAMELDRKIGLVLRQLEADGLAENTAVIFFGDNGEAHVRGKQFCYDSGLHVPLIIRWPKSFAAPRHFQPGGADERLIAAIDLAPTLLDLAGAAKPAKMQGEIFLGERAGPPRRYVFGARDRCDETVFRFRTARDARYRYIRNFTPERPFLQPNEYKEKQYPVWKLLPELHAAGKLTPAQAALCAPSMPEEELYDLEADPHEVENLAGSPRHAETLKRLRAELERWLEESGDQGVVLEPPDLAARKGTTRPGTHPNTGYALEGGPSGAARPAEGKPNIIFILADDLGWADLGCYGQTKSKTPNLDRLAAEGMRFTQHYAGSPVCAPSRCTLLTGRHTGRAQIRDNQELPGEGQPPLAPGTFTLGRLLQQRGYKTAVIGKWGLGGPGSSGEPNQQGFDTWYGYLCQRQAHNYYPDHLWRNGKKEELEGNEGGKQRVGKYYAHDLFAEEALRFIRERRREPFFLYLAFTIPHLPLQVPEDSLAEYRGQFEEEPYDGKKGYLPHPAPRAAYAAMVSRLDRDVGRVLSLLKELGIDDHTLVFFSSDNGPTLDVGGADSKFFGSAGPFRGLKQEVYEGGIRVPLIARWPGRIRPGSTSGHVSAFWDLLPTLAELTGAPAPAGSDGLSFLPALLGRPGQKRHEHLYWEYHGQGGRQAVRLGDWKGVRNDVKKGGPIELYDLSKDPGEQRDVAAEHLEVVRRVREILNARTPSDNPAWNF